jgi:DNA-binding NarL/FixJ family response regulator
MKVVIVEDQQLICDLLRKTCTDLGHKVLAAVATASEAVSAITNNSPDAVILDLILPDLDGFAVVEAIRERRIAARILVCSVRCDTHSIRRIEQLGLDGYIDKSRSMISDLGLALAALSSGQRFFSASFREESLRIRRDPEAFEKLLTNRQQRVLALIGELLTDAEIALRLGVSRYTAEKHRFRIMRKVGIRRKEDLIRYAWKTGLAESIPWKMPAERKLDSYGMEINKMAAVIPNGYTKAGRAEMSRV